MLAMQTNARIIVKRHRMPILQSKENSKTIAATGVTTAAVKSGSLCARRSSVKAALSSMTFRRDVMEASAKRGFTNATDAADYLVNKGVPFRDAHGIVGQLVLLCIEKGVALDDLALEEYKKISPVFEADVYEAISMKNCVDRRNTLGAPGPEAMKKVIAIYKERLAERKD